jgi:hypothetical protein
VCLSVKPRLVHTGPDMPTTVLSFAATTVPAWCTQAEAVFRPPGDGAAVAAALHACAPRLTPILAAANRLLVLRLQERKRRDYERAYAVTEVLVGTHAVAAELSAHGAMAGSTAARNLAKDLARVTRPQETQGSPLAHFSGLALR